MIIYLEHYKEVSILLRKMLKYLYKFIKVYISKQKKRKFLVHRNSIAGFQCHAIQNGSK